MPDKIKSDEAIIARIVLIPKSHWKALGEHSKVTTGKADGRSEIIRKLVGRFLRETGTLRRMKAEDRRRREQAETKRKARDAATAALKKAKSKRRRPTSAKRRAA